MAARAGALRSALGGATSVIRQPAIARAQAAWVLGHALDGGLTVVVAVELYAGHGPSGVAALGVLRMLATMSFGLLAAAILTAWRPDRVLRVLGLGRALAAAAAAALIVAGAPAWSVLPIGAALGAIAAIARPTHNVLLPAVVRTPAELVGANVGTTTGEALGAFAGPLVAAGCLAAGSPVAAATLAAVAGLAAAGAVSGVRFESGDDARGPSGAGAARLGSVRVGLAAGVRALRRRPSAVLVIAGFSLQAGVRGALNTLVVVLSVELLAMGDAGVGTLNAAFGLGGVLGMVAGLLLGRSSPGIFAATLAAWGLPLALIGGFPFASVAVAGLVATGLANTLLDTIGFTLLQRGSRNDERGGVFAILEAIAGTVAAVGSALAAPLVAVAGAQGALVLVGVLLPAAALLHPLLRRRIGAAEAVPTEVLQELRLVEEFAALPLTALERLAEARHARPFAAGEVLMRQGEPGDTFLVIDRGEVRVSDHARELATLGPGSGVGEIALLRCIPRTATVTALTDGGAWSFDAPTFVAAVAGPAATAAANHVVEERLARSRAALAS